MRLFFIRHAESVNNVASQHTNVINSPLTTHGAVQAHRLADRLAKDAVISHVFSSPLTCCVRTAEAISDAQNKVRGRSLNAIQLWELQGREDTESGQKSTDARSSRPKDQLSIDNSDWMHEMRLKANYFTDNYLIPLLCCDDENEMACAIVTQGNELNVLAKAFFDRIPRGDIILPPDPEKQGLIIDSSLVVFPPWAITGVLDVIVSPRSDSTVVQQPTPKLPFQADIRRVNCRSHLEKLQKARGGVGSAPFDEKQRTIHNFFTPLPQTPRPDDLNN
ncbi:histidine phosphatase superfamily (branch 1) domain-containing protein [Pochonia chlamydosporia 170]|uniref:Histidine phosphatase superfamily (Branch 1) domain-containing protein n=1 Tax=Pochonia chlamydosporia 170 TaxID=1380566 RepID=A0A179F0Z1_METCM|nr:histidine phosphatase superfamily (branch 1) domain-containing protein [Pochonia chlamydosporia 170]OAQ59116.1 histidine phosphatase superfamily (branch 1) domain-containing protein [Pochonia chlamydosporia 170]